MYTGTQRNFAILETFSCARRNSCDLRLSSTTAFVYIDDPSKMHGASTSSNAELFSSMKVNLHGYNMLNNYTVKTAGTNPTLLAYNDYA